MICDLALQLQEALGPSSTGDQGWWTAERIWVGIGFLGQGIFGARMLVQWIVSEKAKKSVIPVAFWYMSVVGASITFAYAIWRKDPVFVTAQAGGLLVYLRNLMLIHGDKKGSRDLVV